MLPFFWYLLKVIICSGILFGYYWLFLRNKIFHRYNRFYLLAAMSLSLLLPLLKINFWQHATDSNQAIRLLQAVSVGDEYMNNIVLTAKKSNWSIEQLYPVVYLLVSLIFLFVMLRTLYLIHTLLKKYPIQLLEEIAFINTQEDSTPFSFLKYIFWNSSIDIDTTTGRQIFKHEVAHIQEKHTYDKLFVNIALIFCWCNPFFWLYRKELNMIHEFIADKKAVEDSNTAAFAAMILQAAYPRHRFELANNFFYSPIKRRLLMLTKIDNPRFSYFARLMVLPLAVLVFAAFTFKAKSNKENFFPSPEKKQNTDNVFVHATGSSVNAEQINMTKVKDTVPDNAPIDPEKALLIVNGKNIGKGKKATTEYNNLIAQSVSVKWLKRSEAIAKYGTQGADGACEVNYKEGAVFTTTFVDSDKMSVFYIGTNNPFSVSVPNVKPEDLVVYMSQGSKSGNRGNYIARVTAIGELTITLSKRDGTKIPASFTVKVKRLPDPTDPNFPAELRKNLKIDSTGIPKIKQKIIQEQQAKAEMDYAEKQLQYKSAKAAYENAIIEKKLNDQDLHELKQKLQLQQQNKEKLDIEIKQAAANDVDLTVNRNILQEKELQAQKNSMVFTQVEINPQFTGGEEAWKKYLRENIKASTPVEEGWKEGKYPVTVKFIVHTDGTVSNVTTEKYKGSKTAQHCIEVIKNAPKWQPAVQNGRKVNAYHKQPITFVIE